MKSSAPTKPKSSMHSRNPRPATYSGPHNSVGEHSSRILTADRPATMSSPVAQSHVSSVEQPAINADNANLPKESSLFISARLKDMNTLLRAEQESKYSLQAQLAQLTFELDHKKLSDEELKKQIFELSELTREQKLKQQLLMEQKDRYGSLLAAAQLQLQLKADSPESIENTAAQDELKLKLSDMEEELRVSKSHNSEYEKNIKELMKLVKDVDSKRQAAIEDRSTLEELLNEAKSQLTSLQTKLLNVTDEATKLKIINEKLNRPSSASVVQKTTKTVSSDPEKAASNDSQSKIESNSAMKQPLDTSYAIEITSNTANTNPVTSPVVIQNSTLSDSPVKERPSTTPDAKNTVSADNLDESESKRPSSTGASTRVQTPNKELPSDIPSLRAELVKEESFLNQVTTLRKKVKEDISSWQDKFKAENNRDPSAEDRKAIAGKYKAFQEVLYYMFLFIYSHRFCRLRFCENDLCQGSRI
jgi:hypothetical protein